MPIDPNIALQVKPLQLNDPLAQYAQVSQIQNAQNQNALAQYQLESAQRENEYEKGVQNYFATKPDLTSPNAQAELARFGKTGLGYGKLISEQQTNAMQREKLANEIQKQQQDYENETLKDLIANPSRENIIAHGQKLVINKRATPEQAQAKIDQYLAMEPTALRTYLIEKQTPAKDLMAAYMSKPIEKTDGQTTWTVEGNSKLPTYGKRIEAVPVIQMKTTPGQDLSAKTAKEQLAVSQSRLAFEQNKFAWEKANPGNTLQQLADGSIVGVNTKTMQATPVTLGGQAVKGKPSAFAEKTAVQQKTLARDLTTTINELTSATKDNGLIDQSTGSGAGRLADISMGFVGKATPGAIAIGKLQPIADMALKMVPRFEGPQSDKDTASYKQAAGQLADPTLPTEIRKQAGREVLRLMKARRDQFATDAMTREGTPNATGGGAAPNIDKLLEKYK